MEPIIGNPPDGSSPSCAIVDEVHEHKDSRLIDTMITGMGAREQPIMLYITTAGDNISGPCYQLQIEAQKVLEGVQENDTLFSLIYGIDQGDDWSDLNNMIKANPNYGVSVSEDFLLSRLQDAKNNARKQSTFMTKHLNVWVGSREAFFNVDKWTQCAGEGIKLSDYYGQRIYIGMDLASRVDIAAIEILIPDGENYIRFGKYYLPESAIEGGNESYVTWAREGWLTVTDGEIIDFNIIKDDILELCSQFEVAELAYDPFQATMLITELMAEGVPVVEMRPTVLNFSEPMKSLDALIRAKRIKHNSDPVQTWMISNVVAKEDAKENVYPRKERAENKIDGVISLLMALGRCQHEQETAIDFDNLLTVSL
jgi:phage terminase large subunit-like protein